VSAKVRESIYTQFATTLVLNGVVASVDNAYNGEPEPLPLGEAPVAVVWVEEPQLEYLTMGVVGMVSETYDVIVRVYLGPEDMPAADAQAAQVPLADSMRRVLYSSPSVISGSTWESILGVFNVRPVGGTNNIRTYRAAGEAPYLEYTMEITEHRARSDAAS
jgi:hypothetical protein